jgi:hypothetical protein
MSSLACRHVQALLCKQLLLRQQMFHALLLVGRPISCINRAWGLCMWIMITTSNTDPPSIALAEGSQQPLCIKPCWGVAQCLPTVQRYLVGGTTTQSLNGVSHGVPARVWWTVGDEKPGGNHHLLGDVYCLATVLWVRLSACPAQLPPAAAAGGCL